MMTNFYQVLKIEATATSDEIKAAYARERANRIAQAGANDLGIDEELRTLDEAYATLSESGRRAAYDRSLRQDSTTMELTLPGQPAAPVILADAPVAQIRQSCPHCGAPNPIQATICIECGRQTTRPCPKCGQAVVLGQTVCPRCETFIPEYDQRRFAEAYAVKQQVESERRETDARTVVADRVYSARIWMGTFFWVFVIGLCIVLMILASVLSNYANR